MSGHAVLISWVGLVFGVPKGVAIAKPNPNLVKHLRKVTFSEDRLAGHRQQQGVVHAQHAMAHGPVARQHLSDPLPGRSPVA